MWSRFDQTDRSFRPTPQCRHTVIGIQGVHLEIHDQDQDLLGLVLRIPSFGIPAAHSEPRQPSESSARQRRGPLRRCAAPRVTACKRDPECKPPWSQLDNLPSELELLWSVDDVFGFGLAGSDRVGLGLRARVITFGVTKASAEKGDKKTGKKLFNS